MRVQAQVRCQGMNKSQDKLLFQIQGGVESVSGSVLVLSALSRNLHRLIVKRSWLDARKQYFDP